MEELNRLSSYAGMNENLVQAGGGNSSIKISGTEMLIKASGCQLSEVSDTYGWSRVDYRKISDYLEANRNKVLSEEDGKKILMDSTIEGKRPSIETFLHAITERVTLHTHPTLVNVLTARTDGMKELQRLFPYGICVSYATPGVQLAQKYYEAYMAGSSYTSDTMVVFLKNHGLVVSGDSVDAVIRETDCIMRKLAQYLLRGKSPYMDTNKLFHRLLQWKLVASGQILYYSTDYYLMQAAQKYPNGWNWAFCPDCLVYCGKKMFVVDESMTVSQVESFVKHYGYPTVFLYHGNIYIVAVNVKKAKEVESVLRFSAQVTELNEGYKMDFLKESEQNHLLNWESEKYRKNMR